MITFHGKQELKYEYIAKMKEHQRLDQIIQGQYWTETEYGFKGCAVGCTIEGDDHDKYETVLGIPSWLAHLEDRLFERMDISEAKKFPLQFLQAMPVGVTPEQIEKQVKAPFLIYVLESMGKDHLKEVQDSINRSIELWQRSDVGSKEFKIAAAAAARAAYAALFAYDAAAAALAAVRAADDSDRADRDAAADSAAAAAADATAYDTDRQGISLDFKNKLIELLKGVQNE